MLVKAEDTLVAMKDHVTKVLKGLWQSLAAGNETDVARAKAALAKHIGKLVLTPVLRYGRPIYKVTGSITISEGSGKCRMLVVARDGLEPPTPAFSGLRSTN